MENMRREAVMLVGDAYGNPRISYGISNDSSVENAT